MMAIPSEGLALTRRVLRAPSFAAGAMLLSILCFDLCAQGHPVEVLVRDADGAPVEGVRVDLAFARAVHGSRVHRGNERCWMDRYRGSARTGGDGIASFAAVDPASEGWAMVARLAVPPVGDHQVALPGRLTGPCRLELTMPPTADLRLFVGLDTRGTIRLGEAAGSDHPSPRWNQQHPVEAKIIGGLATFPHVALGGELDYAIRLEGVEQELEGRIAGPTTAGEVLRVEIPELSRKPRLTGRAVDADGAAYADTELGLRFEFGTSSSSHARGADVRTDAEGRFTVRLLVPLPEPGYRRMVLAPKDDRGRGIEAIVDLGRPYEPGLHDLGVLELMEPLEHVIRCSDEELAERYALAQQLTDRTWILSELCLLEMARRGSARWGGFLEQEYRRVLASPITRFRDLQYLTVLRRVQGLPDPLAVHLEEEMVATTFPEFPVVEAFLTNVDAAESFCIRAPDWNRRRPRQPFDRVRVEAFAADGTELPPLSRTGLRFGNYRMKDIELAPGDRRSIRVDLGAQTTFPGPGRYRLRLHYHDEDDVSEARNLHHRIVSSSPWLRVTLSPCRLKLSESDIERMNGWIDAIDVRRAVPRVETPWSAGNVYDGPATRPEDRLYREGLRAVPVLIDRLDDPALDPHRRTWIFGLLRALSGHGHPDEEWALGSSTSFQRWPSVQGSRGGWEKLAEQTASFPEGTRATRVHHAVSEHWRAMRVWFVVDVDG